MDFVYGVKIWKLLCLILWLNGIMYKWQNDVSYDCLLKEFSLWSWLIGSLIVDWSIEQWLICILHITVHHTKEFKPQSIIVEIILDQCSDDGELRWWNSW